MTTTTTTTFTVPNVGCDGCVKTIVNELSALDGVAAVSGEVATKRVTVTYSEVIDWGAIVAALEAIDYSPAETL